MGKKILYIVLGVLVVFGLLFLLWSWFFGGSTNAPTNTGTLGSAGNVTQTTTGGTNSNNGEVPLGSNTNQTQTIPNGQNTGGSVTGGTTGVSSGGTSVGGTSVGGTASIGTGVSGATTALNSVPGVSWLGTPFNPAGINNVAGGTGGSVPNVTITTVTGPNGNSSLVGLLAGTAIAGTLSCAIQAGIVAISTTGLTGSIPAGATSVALSATGVPVSDFGAHSVLSASYALQATNVARNAGKDNVTFLGCIVNTVAKTALQAITVSVVNWINSGFNGKPSFVTNYQQFFTNVADLAAGQFIQGAGLSFLCSPFQLQIKIAVAQSYANRNAQSCSLSKVIGNVNSFMNGNFSQGGWGGLVSFTTVPTNNPYGAFAYAQVGLQTAQQNAVANANRSITPGGFIGLQQLNCGGSTSINPVIGQNQQAALAGNVVPKGCSATLTTPGTVIESSLSSTLDTPLKQLGLASDLDQIISALTTQLMTRTLQNGLTSLSQPTTQTSTDVASQSQALILLNDMQSKSTLAQQLGAIYQGSISDIQSAQAGLSGLANCWGSVASSTNSTSAAQQAAAANITLQSLNDQVTADNNTITQINSGIVQLNQFESEVSNSTSASDIAAITADYNAAVAAGTFVSQTDVTTAQQNRTTLQGQLAATNQSTQTGLAQCNAAH